MPDVRAAAEPVPAVQSALNVEEVARAYYDRIPASSWAWIREMWIDSTDGGSFLIVEDDAGYIWRVPFTITGRDVDFGDPSRVRVEYEDAGDGNGDETSVRTEQPETQARLMARFSRPAGEDRPAVIYNRRPTEGGVSASGDTPSPAAPAPTPDDDADPVRAGVAAPAAPETEGSIMDPKELRRRIGLPEDATDEQVASRLDTLADATPADGDGGPTSTTEQPPQGATDDGGDTGTDGGEGGEQTEPTATPADDDGEQPGEQPGGEQEPTETTDATPAPVAASGTPDRARLMDDLRAAGLAVIDSDRLNRLEAAANEVDNIRERDRVAARDALLDEAIRQGKFAPARRKHFASLYDADPEGTTDTIKNHLAAGAVPVDETGHGDGGDTVVDGHMAEFVGGMLPELAPNDN